MSPLPEPQDINIALGIFLKTVTMEAAQQVLEQYPVLLTDETDLRLGTIIHTARQQGQARTSAALDERRNFIRSIRQESEALNSLPHLINSPTTTKGTNVNAEIDMPTILSALQKLFQISNPDEGVKVLLQHPELLTEQADNVFVTLIDNAKMQRRESFVKVLTGLRALTQEVRQQLESQEEKERLEKVL